MKKIKVLTLLFSLACSLLIVSPTFASSKVQFEGGAEDFVFYPDGKWTETDLFGGLQGAMPGDVRTEKIEVRNTSDEYNYIKIYLRALPHNESNPISEKVAVNGETIATMKDFLSKLEMTVKNGEQVISQAPASEQGGLSNNVLLGSFQKNSGTTLSVSIKVPNELGNTYQYRVGEVDWVFTVEGYTSTGAPDTGMKHETEIKMAGILATAFIVIILGCGYFIYRRTARK